MRISANKSASDIVDVGFTPDAIVVTLADARKVSASLARFPRLLRASAAERANWRLIGGGVGIHWDDVDEDLSLRAFGVD